MIIKIKYQIIFFKTIDSWSSKYNNQFSRASRLIKNNLNLQNSICLENNKM